MSNCLQPFVDNGESVFFFEPRIRDDLDSDSFRLVKVLALSRHAFPTTIDLEAHLPMWGQLTLIERCLALKNVMSFVAFLWHVELSVLRGNS